ncbi:hypothetical protein [Mesonia mobilis]|uniref:Uncharacterized protein n=1 Tax=Mesonia mobilis TaxID=369791 RepID=A0ABQ3BPZ9_9FLAO|nr:hypothetical protein [Mesonia mobilis]MBQ0737388.1 hypothetical protein [Aquimarina celericrescens]GGZ50338.1 hypothetical protein GCM10008088_09910 [Mesonia mobilis]
MAKLYLNESPNEKVEKLGPKKETIKFLLNYSKALHVLDGKHLQYENLLN